MTLASAPAPTRSTGERRATTAHTRPVAPTRPTATRRRPAVVGLGIALVALGALAMVYLTSTLGQTRQVLAVTGTIQRGSLIEASDLAVVDLPAGPTALRAVDAEHLDAIVGTRASVELLPGALLTPSSYTDVLRPAVTRSVVGVALTASQMPTQTLHAGDRVRVVETPVTGGEPPVDDPYAIDAVVVSTESSALGDQMIVNVETDEDDATGLAARAATGRVALVLDSVEG